MAEDPAHKVARQAAVTRALRSAQPTEISSPVPAFGREKAADAPLFDELETGEDFARLGLDIASMSPIGQIGQAIADTTIAGMDLAKGDYPGAAISAAAVGLPMTAGVLKGAVKGVSDIASAGAKTADQVADAAKQWVEKGTDSPYFKRWFGSSGVVDEAGKPLVVYHGTGQQFDRFDPRGLGKNTGATSIPGGMFFTNKADEAAKYMQDQVTPTQAYFDLVEEIGEAKADETVIADFVSNKGKSHYFQNLGTESVLPVYLKMENPYTIDVKGAEWSTELDELILRRMDVARRAGAKEFDGIIIKNIKDIGEISDSYVVFDPTGIKSSIGNRGTFDPTDPRISMGVGGAAAIAAREKAQEGEEK